MAESARLIGVKDATPAGTEVRVVLLDAGHPGERKIWLDLWEQWPAREVMAHPDYVRLFARPADRTVCATARTPRGAILYPLILRPFQAEPWAGLADRGFDLTTPYGYGGPFAWNVDAEEAEAFWTGFDAWATAHGAVTSFTRLSLFEENMIPFRGTLVGHGPNVVRKLDLPEDALWRSYAGKVRANVGRARENGLAVEFDPAGRRLDEFMAVYTSTMERRNASSQYFFPRSFFEAIVRDLAGHFTFVHVLSGRKVVSSEIVLLSSENAYFFLSGTYAAAFSLRPNDLLKHEAIVWCRKRGKRAIVLGGAYRAGDSLLRYKQAFAPDGDRPFFLGLRTFDPEASERARVRRREWERSQGREWTPAPDFFPVYRAS